MAAKVQNGGDVSFPLSSFPGDMRHVLAKLDADKSGSISIDEVEAAVHMLIAAEADVNKMRRRIAFLVLGALFLLTLNGVVTFIVVETTKVLEENDKMKGVLLVQAADNTMVPAMTKALEADCDFCYITKSLTAEGLKDIVGWYWDQPEVDDNGNVLFNDDGTAKVSQMYVKANNIKAANDWFVIGTYSTRRLVILYKGEFFIDKANEHNIEEEINNFKTTPLYIWMKANSETRTRGGVVSGNVGTVGSEGVAATTETGRRLFARSLRTRR